MFTDWQRLSDVINWTGLSTNSFAREIGLHRADRLYHIQKGRHKISKELAEIIVTRYENLSKSWLLTGEGEMLFNEKTKSLTVFPFYAKDITLCMPWDQGQTPDAYLTLPMYKGVEFAALSMSDVMMPDIPKGAMVLFQTVDLMDVVFGKTYYIITKNFKGIRNIRSSKQAESFDLVPVNIGLYDTMTVSKSNIEMLFMVRGIIIDKTM